MTPLELHTGDIVNIVTALENEIRRLRDEVSWWHGRLPGAPDTRGAAYRLVAMNVRWLRKAEHTYYRVCRQASLKPLNDLIPACYRDPAEVRKAQDFKAAA